jgi:hypothetical protein
LTGNNSECRHILFLHEHERLVFRVNCGTFLSSQNDTSWCVMDNILTLVDCYLAI